MFLLKMVVSVKDIKLLQNLGGNSHRLTVTVSREKCQNICQIIFNSLSKTITTGARYLSMSRNFKSLILIIEHSNFNFHSIL